MTIRAVTQEDLRLDIEPISLRNEIKGIIQDMLNSHPRSQQVKIGASEIGTPCTRKLIYKLGDVPATNPEGGTWQQQVGTFIHSGLADMLQMDNQKLGIERWLVETEVTIGNYGDKELVGHVDVYDAITASVIDWKTLGKTNLKKMSSLDDPGPTYRIQLQCYGLGLFKLGYPVNRVHLISLPQSGNLSDMYHWSEPFDPDIAEAALLKAHQLGVMGETLGFAKLAALAATADDYCNSCPWFSPEIVDPEQGKCDGSNEIRMERLRNSIKPPPLRPFG